MCKSSKRALKTSASCASCCYVDDAVFAYSLIQPRMPTSCFHLCKAKVGNFDHSSGRKPVASFRLWATSLLHTHCDFGRTSRAQCVVAYIWRQLCWCYSVAVGVCLLALAGFELNLVERNEQNSPFVIRWPNCELSHLFSVLSTIEQFAILARIELTIWTRTESKVKIYTTQTQSDLRVFSSLLAAILCVCVSL